MGILYHGSKKRGMKKIKPHKLTHGNNVYATPYKELALVFSGKCGDDFTYSIGRNSKNEPFQIVEYKKEDLIDLFEEAVISQAIIPEKEQYLKSIVISVSKIYPELLPVLNEKLSFLEKSKEEKIFYIIDKIANHHKDIPIDLIKKSKEIYISDNRPFSEIGKEIIDFSRKINIAEELTNTPINQDILDNSILLIGPMGTGKSTISKKINEITNMPKVSLDDRNELQSFYQNRDKFDNFKEFEFYLTSSVLTSLKAPSIIDFGGGHSVYENPIMFYEMKKLIKKFKNVELLLPSENIDESLQIVNKRMNSRGGTGPKNAFDTNRFFIESPCNYNLATDIIYTKDMDPDEIANIIITQTNNKKDIKNGSIRK